MINKFFVDEKDQFSTALEDFYRVRNKAKLKEIFARITGEPRGLLSYDEIRSHLKISGLSNLGLKDIPVEAIVGSLGRYNDFTRDFLPRKDHIKERWARVKTAALSLVGLPPIEVYQIGDVYFVKDGNHRVSVSRYLGQKFIQAYVTRVITSVSISPGDDPEVIILKAEQADFLEKTHLDKLRPEANLSLTLAGQYPVLVEHISVHRYFMGIDQNRPVPLEEAVLDWLDKIYMPVIQAIRDAAILRNFPNRTEADLYLWIADHKAALQKELGWNLHTENAVRSFSNRFKKDLLPSQPILQKITQNFLPKRRLSSGSARSSLGHQSSQAASDAKLFRDVLVAVSADDQYHFALKQSLVFAQKEAATIQGLHVINEEIPVESKAHRAQLETDFRRFCSEEQVSGNLAIERGEAAAVICDRARFVDLVITTLSYPPGPNVLDRLESGFHELIQRCPQPILAIPHVLSRLEHGLLAYNGSPKSNEALFIAAYLADQWKISLTLLSVDEGNRDIEKIFKYGVSYCRSRKLPINAIQKKMPAAEAILETCAENNCDFLIMGGYGLPALVEVLVGSTVNQVLQEVKVPVLICK